MILAKNVNVDAASHLEAHDGWRTHYLTTFDIDHLFLDPAKNDQVSANFCKPWTNEKRSCNNVPCQMHLVE